MTQREFNNKLKSIAQSNYPLPKPIGNRSLNKYVDSLLPLHQNLGYSVPFNNDVFAWGYSATQWGVILTTIEYHNLLEAAYLDITPKQIEEIEYSKYCFKRLLNSIKEKQPVEHPTNIPINFPVGEEKFLQQIYTAYWHEVKRGNIKASTEKRELPEWAKLESVSNIFEALCKADYCKKKVELYEWNKSASAWVYFIARLADAIQETGLKDSGGRYKWKLAKQALTNPPKQHTITGSADKLKEPDEKGNNVFRKPRTDEEIFIENIIKDYL